MSAVRSSGPRKRVLLAMHWWEDRVFEGVARYAAEHGWVLNCRMRWTREPGEAAGWRPDGIIANPGVGEPSGPIARLLARSRVPCVDLQAFGRLPGQVRVHVDHEAVGRLAARHLLELDLPQYAFVRFARNPLEAVRASAFAREIRSARKPCRVWEWPDFRRGLGALPLPLGVMAANDANALEVVTACLEAGLSVPEDVAVVGVDDSRIVCDLAEVPLSSVNCHFERQGYEAARTLHALMQGRRPAAQVRVIAPAGVQRRRSTDRLVVPDAAAQRALRYMRVHFAQCQGIGPIVAEAGCSARRLQTLFRRHLGRTVVQELNRLRVEAALGHLRNPALKLDSVARLSGFSDRFHLLRAFRRVRGEAPQEHRRRLLEAGRVG